MDFVTSCVRLFLRHRVRAIARYATRAEDIQRHTLAYLVRQASHTQWGREHGYGTIRSYEDFAAQVPIGNYATLKPYIMKMMDGGRDILWKGLVTRFATSSGTTSDAVKFIPVSKRHLRHGHMKGGHDVTATYLDANRNSRISRGHSLILSGNFAPQYSRGRIKAGDISACMAEAIPPFLRKLLHIEPPLEISQLQDIHEKYDAISDVIARKNLVSFSGLPNWNIMLLELALKKAGARTAEELWPNMEFFAHGGTSLVPYRHRLNELFPSGRLHFIENYNATEGFFGVQTDLSDPAMTLMLDYDAFYEFIPMDVYGTPEAKAVPVWKVKTGVDYAVIVSTSSGLWRYDIGDVVRFTRKTPYRFVIVGRTHQSINVWGEDLSVQQAEKALEHACRRCGSMVKEFTVAPVCLEDTTGWHQWLVEFGKEPASMEEFAAVLDDMVKEEDHDYMHFRAHGGVKPLTVISARPGLFYDWLDAKGKMGGQHKIPRLCDTRKYMDELLEMNQK